MKGLIFILILLMPLSSVSQSTTYTEVSLILDKNNIFHFSLAQIIRHSLEQIGLKIILFDTAQVDMQDSNSWDLSISSMNTPEQLDFSYLYLNKLYSDNIREIISNQTYDKYTTELDSLLDTFPLNKSGYEDFNRKFFETYLYSLPLYQKNAYYVANNLLMQNRESIYEALITQNISDYTFLINEDLPPNINFDPLSYDEIPEWMEPILTPLVRVTLGGKDIFEGARDFTITRYTNSTLLNYELNELNYSTDLPILPEDYIFTLDLMLRMGKDALTMNNYYTEGNHLLINVTGNFDIEKYHSLFPTPNYLLNKTLHIDTGKTIVAFDPLSEIHNFYDSIEWHDYRISNHSSGLYNFDSLNEYSTQRCIDYINRNSSISLCSSHLPPNSLFDLALIEAFQSEDWSISHNYNIQSQPWFTESYHLIFNLVSFNQYEDRKLMADMIKYNTDLSLHLSVSPHNSLISPAYLGYNKTWIFSYPRLVPPITEDYYVIQIEEQNFLNEYKFYFLSILCIPILVKRKKITSRVIELYKGPKRD